AGLGGSFSRGLGRRAGDGGLTALDLDLLARIDDRVDLEVVGREDGAQAHAVLGGDAGERIAGLDRVVAGAGGLADPGGSFRRGLDRGAGHGGLTALDLDLLARIDDGTDLEVVGREDGAQAHAVLGGDAGERIAGLDRVVAGTGGGLRSRADRGLGRGRT